MSEEDFTDVLDVNLTGTFRMCQAAYPALRRAGWPGTGERRGGEHRLHNGHIAVLNTLGYCVSKAGVMHMAQACWPWSGRPTSIRVNAVGPTIVPTDMTSDVRGDEAYMADKMASIPWAGWRGRRTSPTRSPTCSAPPPP